MSRYRENVPYRDPPSSRWNADRFAREREYRAYDDYYEPPPPPGPPQRQPPRAPVFEEERERYYYEDDRVGPYGRRSDRRYFEEDDYYDPRAQRGQMVPFRPERPSRPEAPPRPGLLRRQSSLDTFDRPPQRRYEDHPGYRRERPPRVNINLPEPPSPRSNRYRRARPERYYEYDEREYDDVYIQEPEYYGDDGFREYREREWVSHRRRDSSGSRSRSRPPPREEVKEEVKEEIKEEVKEDKTEIVRKEEIREEFKKEEVKEKPYPRKGKTRMPKRLVHTKVLFDLGYPFYEENEKTIIIEKALGPDNIDEVFAKSREYREAEVSNTRLIEAPPPQSTRAPTVAPSVRGSVHESVHESFHEDIRAPSVRESVRESFNESVHESVRAPPSVRAPSVKADTVRDEIIRESEVRTIPLSEAPRSVREWDQLTVKDDTRTVRSRSRRRSSARSKSRHARRSPSPRETVIERRETVIEREPSPARTHRARSRARSKHRSRASVDETEYIERKIIREEDDFGPGLESDAIKVGPLALVVDHSRPSMEEREVQEEIRALEAERRELKRERKFGRDRDSEEYVRIERRISRSPSPRREIIIDRRDEEEDLVEVRKDRRERSVGRARAPSAGLIRGMFYTMT